MCVENRPADRAGFEQGEAQQYRVPGAFFASVNLGGVFAVNNIRIYNTENGPYVSMPSTKLSR